MAPPLFMNFVRHLHCDTSFKFGSCARMLARIGGLRHFATLCDTSMKGHMGPFGDIGRDRTFIHDFKERNQKNRGNKTSGPACAGQDRIMMR